MSGRDDGLTGAERLTVMRDVLELCEQAAGMRGGVRGPHTNAEARAVVYARAEVERERNRQATAIVRGRLRAILAEQGITGGELRVELDRALRGPSAVADINKLAARL